MKAKAKIILRSLADLPADALAFAASVSERAFATTKQVLVPPVSLTRRQIRAARQRSSKFVSFRTARAMTPLPMTQPWPRGGLNE